MQPVSHLVEHVSYVTGEPRKRVSQFARDLINNDLLPKSEGRKVAKANGAQLAHLLAAVAFADKVADASKVAQEVANLPLLGKPIEGFASYPEVFAQFIKYGGPQFSITFSKQKSGLCVVVNFIDDKAGLEGLLPFTKNRSKGGWVSRDTVMDHEGMTILRNLFCRDYEAEEIARRDDAQSPEKEPNG